MRVALLALMIVLLPLRGWMGDAMALGLVAPQHAHGVQHHASGPADQVHQADAASHDHHAARAANPSPCEDPLPTQHQGCTACQICHSVAIPAMALATDDAQPARMAPPQVAPSFTSAELRHGQKPPIS